MNLFAKQGASTIDGTNASTALWLMAAGATGSLCSSTVAQTLMKACCDTHNQELTQASGATP